MTTRQSILYRLLDLKDSILYPVLVNSVKNWVDKTNNEGNVRGKLDKLISNIQSVMDGGKSFF